MGLRLTKTVEEHLSVKESDIISKMASIAEMARNFESEDGAELMKKTLDCYMNNFTKEELVALVIDHGSEAGMLTMRFEKLLDMNAIDPLKLLSVMANEENVDIKMIKEQFEDGKPDKNGFD